MVVTQWRAFFGNLAVGRQQAGSELLGQGDIKAIVKRQSKAASTIFSARKSSLNATARAVPSFLSSCTAPRASDNPSHASDNLLNLN